jgi:hypothetical protein
VPLRRAILARAGQSTARLAGARIRCQRLSGRLRRPLQRDQRWDAGRQTSSQFCGVGEHDTLTGALAAHYNGQLGELQESDDRQDITYLANKTGWGTCAVAIAALADQFSQGSANVVAEAIKPDFYYALFRAGLPANPDTLYQADAQTVEGVWKQAIEQEVIPNAFEGEFLKAGETFQNLFFSSSADTHTFRVLSQGQVICRHLVKNT